MNASLATLLDRRSLRRMAGGRSFERGEEYFDDGHVRALVEHAGTATATVLGSREYRVKLWEKSGEIEYSCTCPVGAEGAFCKHCVAVGLALLAEQHGGGKASKKSKRASVTMDDVRAYLAAQDKTALVDLLMKQAMDDDRLRERLLMTAARKGPKGFDIETFRAAIDNAVEAGGDVDYRGMYEYAGGIDEVIDSVEELLKEGHADAVIELTEHALGAVEDAMESVDDSDGHMGGLLERLQEIHLAACNKARPDPEELANRLFERELHADYDVFYGAAETYAKVLGEKGLAVYRRLAEAEWARVPSLAPGRNDSEGYGRRFRITHIMETLAGQSGDVEALVAVKRRDLSHAHAYLQIAEIYKQERKHDEALEWAERGLKAFPERTDARLREFLADEYHRRKRHNEAMALIWAEFAEAPHVDQYKKLKAHADRTSEWPAWREKALAFVRETIAGAKKKARKDQWAWAARADHSELVKIFLWEKDPEAAWREAKEGGCAGNLWLDLAAQREKAHPEDVLPVYRDRIEPVLAQKNNDAYKEAIGLIRKVKDLLTRLGRPGEIASYLESLRAAHKPKRNFMKLLDAMK